MILREIEDMRGTVMRITRMPYRHRAWRTSGASLREALEIVLSFALANPSYREALMSTAGKLVVFKYPSPFWGLGPAIAKGRYAIGTDGSCNWWGHVLRAAGERLLAEAPAAFQPPPATSAQPDPVSMPMDSTSLGGNPLNSLPVYSTASAAPVTTANSASVMAGYAASSQYASPTVTASQNTAQNASPMMAASQTTVTQSPDSMDMSQLVSTPPVAITVTVTTTPASSATATPSTGAATTPAMVPPVQSTPTKPFREEMMAVSATLDRIRGIATPGPGSSTGDVSSSTDMDVMVMGPPSARESDSTQDSEMSEAQTPAPPRGPGGVGRGRPK